ncbi:MAG: substrate-binding domain-containing protein [bacterium]
MKRLRLIAGLMCMLLVVGVMGNFAAAAPPEKYNFVFITQWGPESAFSAVVEKGMKDAAEKVGVNSIMYRPPREGDLAAQLSSFEAALLRKPDGIITTIPHPTMYNEVIQKAFDQGIPVISSNTNGLIGTGHPLEKKIPYIGQDLFYSGYVLATKASEYLSEPSEMRALVGVEVPGASWAEARAGGQIKFLEEHGYTYEKLDVGTEMATIQSRILAYLKKHPETNVVFTQGAFGPAPSGKAVRLAGYKPGEIIVVGYDVLPVTASEIKKGYVTFVIDQQPYLQGFLPVMQLYLRKKYGFSPWDVDTGLGIVDESNVSLVEELAIKRIR